jgi:hypothetical protein
MVKSRKDRNRKSRKNRSNRRNRLTRNHRQNGGGGGAGWSPFGAISPQAYWVVDNKPYDACLSATRPGQIAFQPTGGLPGMSSGVQKGGRYTNNLEAGTLAGFAQIDKVACTPNLTDPLNPPATPSTYASPVLTRLQTGGVGLVGASDTGVYEAPTSRYMVNPPNPIISATGVPIAINLPLNPTLISKACTQTGGRRRHRHSKNCKCRKHRKSRKNRN